MRHVFSNCYDVAHLFAQNTQQDARTTTGNFYFKDGVIYSYGSHFPIAKHIIVKGKQALLFTERHYSRETTKHVSAVRHATQHIEKIYCYRPDYSHSDNFGHWLGQAIARADMLIKARKPEIYLTQIEYIKVAVELYAKFFDITIPLPLLKIINIGNKDDYKQYKEKCNEYLAKEERELKARMTKQHTKDLKKWYAFELNVLSVNNGYDYLRYNRIKNRIETTQNVQIPYDIAKKFYEAMIGGVIKLGSTISQFSVNYFDEKIVKIGCHTFKIKYLLEFGKTIFNQS